MNLAQIVIAGNVVNEPDARLLSDGRWRTRFRVAATSRTLDPNSGRWKDGDTTFLAVVALPLVLIGSALLQIYVFFSWLELRALRPMLAHNAPAAGGPSWLTKLRSRLGKAPPMPWISIAVLFVLPLLLLGTASPKIALLVVALAIAAPITYAQLDR